jgi:hypothetical protein
MIVLQHIATGQIAAVASLDGHGDGWAIVANPAPADYASGFYAVHDGALVPDLPAARLVQRALINAGRDAAQDGGCDVAGIGRFDTGERARQFLSGAVLAAQLALAAGEPFAVDWTLADNSVVTLDAAALVAAGQAVAAHINAMHQRGRVLKERIESAASLADIAAIVWSEAD